MPTNVKTRDLATKALGERGNKSEREVTSVGGKKQFCNGAGV